MGRFVAIFLAFTIILLPGSTIATTDWFTINCFDTLQYFSMCLDFLQGKNPEPNKNCCYGIRELNKMAKPSKEAKKICRCIDFVSQMPPYFLASNINALPNICHTHFSIPLAVHMNCTQ
ncbi:Tryp_alpha_amyl domain-containing protein [Cephalotus follicularis]|uniref:Tryp_alpha_amyl domain-containing protein n=1 Tax=Cephalotus follicularis TaxID=3775 RepID=A0A1Q3CK29_CEPFO|nr:Tryp_alpha_amyl domain-containing protein [Cephalotus follicularis]